MQNIQKKKKKRLRFNHRSGYPILTLFCAGDYDAKLYFCQTLQTLVIFGSAVSLMSLHQIDSLPECCVSLNNLLRKVINVS